MRRGLLVGAVAIVLASLTLAGCAASVPGSEPSSASSPASESPSPTPVVANGLVVSLDAISGANNDGSTGDSAPFSSGPATLALLSHTIGTTPAPTYDEVYDFTTYDWGALTLNLDSDGTASVFLRAPELGGLALRTAEGIHVGSTLAQVQAVASSGTELHSTATSDIYFGLEARAHPGTESLDFPGQAGKDYIDVNVQNGVVVLLIAPSGDWQDL